MKNLIPLSMACLFFVSCYAPKRNCKDFRTGTFTYETYMNGELVKTKFVRTDTLEVEYFKGEIDSSSVRWINDCNYILTNLNPENKAEEKSIQISILTTDKNSYTFEFSIVGSHNKQKGTALKVE